MDDWHPGVDTLGDNGCLRRWSPPGGSESLRVALRLVPRAFPSASCLPHEHPLSHASAAVKRQI